MSKRMLHLTFAMQAAGDVPHSMLKHLLTQTASQPSHSEEEEDCIRWATGTLFGGAF